MSDNDYLDGEATGDDVYEMLYRDTSTCRVNTSERGRYARCPGCNQRGLPVPSRSGR